MSVLVTLEVRIDSTSDTKEAEKIVYSLLFNDVRLGDLTVLDSEKVRNPNDGPTDQEISDQYNSESASERYEKASDEKRSLR